jgi:hypothetical protein
VEQNPQFSWDYYLLSRNSMQKGKEQFVQQKIKEYFKNEVFPEMMSHCLHPDNFFKLYGLGLHENKYD